MAQDDTVSVKFGAEIGDLKDKLNEASEAVKSAAEKMTGAFGALERTLLSVTAILAGGEAFKSMVESSTRMADEVNRVSQTLGITAQEASTLTDALGDVGSSTEQYLGISQRFGRQLRNNEQVLIAAGIATRDSSNHLRNQGALLQEVFAHLKEYATGADRNQEAIRLLGGRVGDLTALMRLNKEVMNDAAKTQKELGSEITPNNIAASIAYHRAMHDVTNVIEAVEKVVGDVLIPRLTELATWFRSIGPEVVGIMRKAMELYVTVMDSASDVVGVLWEVVKTAFKGIGDIIVLVFGTGGSALTAMEFFKNSIIAVQLLIIGFRVSVLSALEFIKGGFKELGILLGGAVAAMDRALHRDWAGVGVVWKATLADMKKATSDTFTSMANIAAKGKEDMERAIAGPTAPEKGTTDMGGMKHSNAKDIPGLATAEMTLAKVKAEALANLQKEYLREAQAWEDEAYKHSEISTRDYYAAKLAIQQAEIDAGLNAKREELADLDKMNQIKKPTNEIEQKKFEAERAKITGEINVMLAKRIDLTRSLARAEDDENRTRSAAMQTTLANETKNAAEARIAMQRSVNKQAQDLRLLDAHEAFMLQKQEEDKSFEATKKFLQAKLDADLLTSKNEAQTRADARVAEEQAEAQHQQKITDIDHQAELERKKYSLEATKSVQDAAATMFQDFMKGTKSLSQAFNDFASSVMAAMQRILAQQFAEKLLGAGSTGGGALSGLMGKAFSWIPKFDVGTNYVPNDMLAVVHRGERIVPAAQNNPAMMGGGGQSVSVVNHFTVSGGVDRRTQEQMAALAGLSIQRAMARNV